jgi:hypothetical protein
MAGFWDEYKKTEIMQDTFQLPKAPVRYNSHAEPWEGIITKVEKMYRISLRGEEAMLDHRSFDEWWQYATDFIRSNQGHEDELRIQPFLEGLKAK